MKKAIAAISIALCLAASLAWAHGKATGIVRERMDNMVILKDAMKILKAELSDGDAYDSATVLSAAQKIENHSGEALIAKFPEGSLSKHSEALPSVWTKSERFSSLAFEMEQLAGSLKKSVEAKIPNVKTGSGLLGWLSSDTGEIAPGELMSPYDTFRVIADTCRDCHDDYRSE